MKKNIHRKPAEKKEPGSALSFLQEPRTRVIIGLTLILLSCYLFFAFCGFFLTGGIDQSLLDKGLRKIVSNPDIVVENPAGKLGAWISDLFINRWFGVSSFLLCYLLILCGIRTAGRQITGFRKKILITLFLILWISLFLGYFAEMIYSFFDIRQGYLYPGGAHGYFVTQWLNALTGGIGTFLLLLLTFATILFFGFEQTFYKCLAFLKNLFPKKKEKLQQTSPLQETATDQETPEFTDEPEPVFTSEEELRIPEEDYETTPETEEKDYAEPANDLYPETDRTDIEKGFENIPASINDFEFQQEITDMQPADEWDTDKPEELLDYKAIPEENEENEENEDDEDIELTVNTENQEETVAKNIEPEGDYDPTLDLSNYQYPSLDLLEEHSSGNPKVTQEELDENKNKIVETLRNYKIEIVKIKATIGPTVTLYEIIPAPGVKISKIKNLEDDIALSLAALGIRIIAPIPGAGTIGIEVPNQNPEIVSMRGIIASKKFQESKYALPIALGRTISNETYTFDLAKMPHLLVAGATGQGKSVGLNAIITSLLYKKHPSQLKFVMVDPKKVELSIYSVIEKHFLAKLPDEDEAIITETTKVINTLNSLCIEMDSRYDLLKEAQVRNIKEYNEKFVKRHLNPAKGHKYLPYIVVVVDEFADLIMTAGKDVETPIARIAQLARAVGIHMIIATQRPSTNIITGVIKANFPARIAFKVASMIDSRTILDSPGANQLIGRGDMLISVGSEMTRVQCAFVDTPEIDAITHYIAGQQSYPSAFALPEYTPEGEGGGGVSDADLGAKDPLFEEAARLVVNSQQGSTSSIQRRFSIGYNRAGRIIDHWKPPESSAPLKEAKPVRYSFPTNTASKCY